MEGLHGAPRWHRRRADSLATALAALAGAATAGIAWGWYEAGWVRLRSLDLAVPGLPPELEGLRIAHLSDFHLGLPSRGTAAARRAVEWTAERRPDLVVLSGDLVARPRGMPVLEELLARLPPVYGVLGNHDFADSRDPFSRPVGEIDLGAGTLLSDSAITLELRGKRVQIAGIDPRTYMRREARPEQLADESADLRILLSHFPRVLDYLPNGAYHLVLAGHMHDGQICVPYPGGKLRLAHLHAPYTHGVYRRGSTVLHVSPGLGTTFVPFRFFARPEATELVLHSG
jgi:predicted MPP superfamily phosphohydrolase